MLKKSYKLTLQEQQIGALTLFYMHRESELDIYAAITEASLGKGDSPNYCDRGRWIKMIEKYLGNSDTILDKLSSTATPLEELSGTVYEHYADVVWLTVALERGKVSEDMKISIKKFNKIVKRLKK